MLVTKERVHPFFVKENKTGKNESNIELKGKINLRHLYNLCFNGGGYLSIYARNKSTPYFKFYI